MAYYTLSDPKYLLENSFQGQLSRRRNQQHREVSDESRGQGIPAPLLGERMPPRTPRPPRPSRITSLDRTFHCNLIAACGIQRSPMV